MSMLHELKIDPGFVPLIARGLKNFEIRQNDRNYTEGDVLMMREYNRDKKEFTGPYVKVGVYYILNGDNPLYGLKEGFVCMSVRVLSWGEDFKHPNSH